MAVYAKVSCEANDDVIAMPKMGLGGLTIAGKVALRPFLSALSASRQFPVPLQIWKLPSLVLLLKLEGHRRGVWDASFSPLEQIVATSSGDKTIKLWSIADGSCLRTLQGHSASVLRLHYMEAGTQVRLWRLIHL